MKNDRVWRLLLLHCEIVRLCLTDSHDVSIEHLKSLVREHNDYVYKFSPGNKPKAKCKLHYLSHYPDLLTTYGSLKMYWNMRFEGMHRKFKDIIEKAKQYKNVPYTCANRFQAMRALSTYSQWAPSDDDIITSGFESHCVSDVIYPEVEGFINSSLSESLKFDEPIYTCLELQSISRNIKLSSRKSSCVVMRTDFESDPLFFLVEKLLNIRGKWFVLARRLFAIFHPHFNAYSVSSKDSSFKCISLSTIRLPSVSIHTVRGVQCIAIPLTYPTL